jgi:hypothetical protein
LFIELARSYAAIDWLVGLLIYVVVPGFCWTVAWLRVRETQVSHGI